MVNIRASLLAVFVLFAATPVRADAPTKPPVVRGCASAEERWAAGGCRVEEDTLERGSSVIKSAEHEIRAAREAVGGVDPSQDYALSHYQDLIARAEARISKARTQMAVVEPQLVQCRAHVARLNNERTTHMAAFRSDMGNWQVLYSAKMCWFQEGRTTALDAIRQEHKYARMGGALNLRLLYEQQVDVARADAGLVLARKGLGLAKRPPLMCSNKIVKALRDCLFQEDDRPVEWTGFGSVPTCAVETDPCRLPPLSDYIALEE